MSTLPPNAGSILEWLRQMAEGSAAGVVSPGPTAVMPSPRALAPPPVAPTSMVPPSAPSSFSGAPMYKPWDFSQGFNQVIPGAPAGGSVPPGTGPLAFPTPQTKTEPRTPLQFAWGGGTPQNYTPGVSKILEMKGAPEARTGFMGATPDNPMQGGGYVLPPQTPEGQTDWKNVANPMGFDAFREAPQVNETLRAIEDPMWRERQQAEIDQARDIAVGGALIDKQSEAELDQLMRLQGMLEEQATQMELEENRRRARNGEPPMTEEERQDLYMQLQARMSGVDPLTGT